MKKIQDALLVAGLALGLALGLAQPASALTLYANYDPLQTGPVDYQTGNTASLSGYCNGSFTCNAINVYSVGFTFTPSSTGYAGHAYIPFDLLSRVSGAENLFSISINDGDGYLIARGTRSLSSLAANTITDTDTVVFDLTQETAIGYGDPLPDGPLLQEGETYSLYFHQFFGSMATNVWYKSNEVPEDGQATQYCRTNVGGTCAWWVGYWQAEYDALITDYLPAIAITDAEGYTDAPAPTPEPASLALLALGLAGLATARRRR